MKRLVIAFGLILGAVFISVGSIAAYVVVKYNIEYNEDPSTAQKISLEQYKPLQDKGLLNRLQPLTKTTKFNDLSIGYGPTDTNTQGYAVDVKYTDNTNKPAIVVSRTTKPEDLDVVLAHEYLHTVWDKMDSNTRIVIERGLFNAYFKDAKMQEVMKIYQNQGTFAATELFSFYCTSFKDNEMTPDVLENCNMYINRGAFDQHVIYKY